MQPCYNSASAFVSLSDDCLTPYIIVSDSQVQISNIQSLPISAKPLYSFVGVFVQMYGQKVKILRHEAMAYFETDAVRAG